MNTMIINYYKSVSFLWIRFKCKKNNNFFKLQKKLKFFFFCWKITLKIHLSSIIQYNTFSNVSTYIGTYIYLTFYYFLLLYSFEFCTRHCILYRYIIGIYTSNSQEEIDAYLYLGRVHGVWTASISFHIL